MKILKGVVIVLGAILLLGAIGGYFYFKNKFMSAPPNQITTSNLGKPFDFIWVPIKVNEKLDPYGAMYVPVTIPGVDRIFYMQFDTGAHSTVMYYEKVRSINEKYGNLFKLDTVDQKLQITGASFQVGTVNLDASKLAFRGRGDKIDWSDTTTIIKLGTIGSDFIENHPIVIDYQNQKITLMESAPENQVGKSEFLPLTFDARKVFLSAELNNKPASLWYDSGSSAFEYIVEESTFLELAQPGAEKETYTANSWGDGVVVNNLASNGEFTFGSVKVPLKMVTYIEWPNKIQALMMKASSIGGDYGGMTGNKLFLGKILILDIPNLRYAVVE